MILSDENYKTIYSQVPRLCLDLLILNEKGHVLLGQRSHPPFLNEWALPGSRLRFGETIFLGIQRILREELNYKESINGYVPEIAGYVDFSNEIELIQRHSVSMVFKININSDFTLEKTECFSNVGFFEKKYLHNYKILHNHLEFLNIYEKN